MSKIVNKIKYAEDCSVYLMIADGIEINFFDNYLIWYESDSGISNSKNSIWIERLWTDSKECFDIIIKKYPKMKWIYRLNYGKYHNLHIVYRLIKKIRYNVLNNKRKKRMQYDFNQNILKKMLKEK